MLHSESSAFSQSSKNIPEASSSVALATSSKLLPAPAPLVNAWGSKHSGVASSDAASTRLNPTLNSKPTKDKGTLKSKWPSAADAESSKDAKIATLRETVKSINIPPKPVRTGKEKWIPYEATIVISSTSALQDNNQHPKKEKTENGHSNKTTNNKGNDGTRKHKNQHKNRNKNSNNYKNKSSSKGHNNEKPTEKNEQNPIPEIHELELKLNAPEPNDTSIVSSVSAYSISTTTAETEIFEKASKNNAPISRYPNKLSDTPQQSNFSISEKNTVESRFLDDNLSIKDHTQKHNNETPSKTRLQHRNYGPTSGFSYHYNNQNPWLNQNYNNNYRSSPDDSNIYRPSSTGTVPYVVNPYLSSYGVVNPAFNSNAQFTGSFDLAQSFNSIPPLNDPTNRKTPNQFLPAPNPYLYSAAENSLSLVVGQLNYYFSFENLVRDFYLRKQMNSEGFVPLEKLLEFKRLKSLTGGDINKLNEAFNFTPNLELVDRKVRLRYGWERWVLPNEQRDSTGKEEGS